MKNKKIYYLTGPDGSGKTSYLLELEKKLLEQKKNYKHIWIRSPKILSKPLMLVCRITGLTKYKIIDGVKYGKHEFYRSKLVSALYPVLQYIDFWIKYKLEKRKIKGMDYVLFDRFALDTLADIMVATNKMDLYTKPIGQAFIRLIPENNIRIIVLNANENIIRQRKKDTLHDEHLTNKLYAYKRISNELSLKVIDNNRPFEDVKKEIFESLDL